MTLRCSKQRFFPLKTLSTEEEDSAILHVSSPNLLETAKQPTESSDESIGTKHQKCLRSNLVSAGPKTSEYVSRRRWASEFLGCTLTWVDSISAYLVWNSKRLDFIWKTLVSLCVLFHCVSLCVMWTFWEFHVVSDSKMSQALRFSGAENAFGAKFRLAALCAKAAARLGSRFSDISVVNFLCIFVKRSTQGLLCSAMIWSYKMCATTRWKYSAWAPKSVEWSHGVGAKSSKEDGHCSHCSHYSSHYSSHCHMFTNVKSKDFRHLFDMFFEKSAL